MIKFNQPQLFTFLPFSILFPPLVRGDCTCDLGNEDRSKALALKYKMAAIVSILVATAIGVCFPLLGKTIDALYPEMDVFFVIKAFAVCVILSTRFIHVLPDAIENFTSHCLDENPWWKFSFVGIAHGDEEKKTEENEIMLYISTQLLRYLVSQVLELRIVMHSVIIGIFSDASKSPKTIKLLTAALTFHQFFEGMGLDGCILQARFKARCVAIMVLFFSLTTPVGIGIGIRISNTYNENNPMTLVVEGMLNAASAWNLIYMALVDLLAVDFMNPKLQNDGKMGPFLVLL
ncbi:hypothetical protein ES332_D08G065100v1 [Gossypium tomentosum]|uniref:Uncharacterized protein n=1 Tax=Gossypium tomentosum TaxID=34277 RepID=A0A5D2JQJ2_GOSTO|nr:hypothetical protein ES332_D08G065100v1 [Gossypium tomentosum]